MMMLVLAELRRHVHDDLGDAEGVRFLDAQLGLPEVRSQSCGVARQSCGRLGKVDNAQAGVFLTTPSHHAAGRLIDCRLFLPEAQAADAQHRQKTYVPPEVAFAEKWPTGLLRHSPGQEVAHGWVVGDDEFGRVSELRAALRADQERYVLDVPLQHPGPRPEHAAGTGAARWADAATAV